LFLLAENVGTVCLPLGNLASKTFGGEKGVVAGWGKTGLNRYPLKTTILPGVM